MPSRGRFVRPLAGAGRVRRGLHRAHWRQDHARCAGQRAGAQQEVGRYDGEVNYWPCHLRMTHRGACSADNDSGDGAGALLGIPHSFYVETLKYDLFFLLFTFHSFNWKCFFAREESNIDLPSKGRYGTGIIFMDPDTTESCRFVDNDNVMAVWLPALALVNNNSYPERSSQSWQPRSDSRCWCGETRHVTTNVSVRRVSGLYWHVYQLPRVQVRWRGAPSPSSARCSWCPATRVSTRRRSTRRCSCCGSSPHTTSPRRGLG